MVLYQIPLLYAYLIKNELNLVEDNIITTLFDDIPLKHNGRIENYPTPY